MSQHLITTFSRFHKALLVIIWLLAQLFLYQQYDVKIVFDSKRYLYIADQVLTGTYHPEGNLSYFSYILFIVAFLKAGFSVKAVIAAQVLLSGLGAICLYNITRIVTSSQVSSFCAALLFICWPDLQSWNFYIHTESVFVSLSLFVLYLIIKPYNIQNLFTLLFLLLIILFIRPNGFIVWLAIVAFYISSLLQKNPSKGKLFLRVTLVAGIPLFTWLSNTILYNIRNIFSFKNYFEKGQILQGYTGWVIKPEVPFKTPSDGQPIVMLIDLLRLNGMYILKVMALRFAIFIGQIRPYYNYMHNLLIMLFMYPVYVLAVYTLIFQKNMAAIKAFIITLLVAQTGITLISAVDWDNRFIVPLLPFIFILAGIAVGTILERKVKFFNRIQPIL